MNVDSLDKVIIFGASGFIGSRINTLLREESFKVTGYSSSECNLLDTKQVALALKECNKNTAVILLSSITPEKNPSYDAMLKNIAMVYNLATLAKDNHIRNLLFTSSVDVYGVSPKILPVFEGTEIDPKGYYGLSKFISEKILQHELNGKSPLTILRLPGVYGYGDKFKSVIGRFIKKIVDNEPIEIYGNGSIRRDFIEADDLYKVIRHFIRFPVSCVVNIASGKATAMNDVISTLEDAINKRVNIRIKPAESPQSNLSFDISKLKFLYPEAEFISIKEGIEKYLSNLRGFEAEDGRNKLT